MKQKMQAGAEFDFTNPRETREIMNQVVAEFFQEKASGITIWRADTEGTVAAGAVTMPANGEQSFGTDNGMAVLVQYLRVAGLITGDSISIYRNAVTDRGFIGQLTSAAPILKFGGDGLILKGGERLVFTGTSLSATTVSINGEGIEGPEVDLYKLVSA